VADTLLHLALARHLLDDPRLHPALRTLLRRCDDAYRLGSVLIDLPYYHGLGANALRTLQRQPVQYHPLGNRLHDGGAHARHLHATARAQTDAERALVLGMWTHYAADAVFHAFVERRLAELQAQGIRETHRNLEGALGLHCQWAHFGHSGEGHPSTAHLMRIPLPRGVRRFAESTLNGATSDGASDDSRSPQPPAIDDWLGALYLYGVLHSRRFPWVRWLPEDDPALLESALSLFDRVTTDALRYMHGAHQCMTGQLPPGELAALIPRVSLQDGTPA